VKTVKADKVREMAVTELGTRAGAIREELFKLRFQQATGQLENPSRVRVLRRELARVLTVQHEQAVAAAKPSGKAG
jgi:large subunit ribosomal protein L29